MPPELTLTAPSQRSLEAETIIAERQPGLNVVTDQTPLPASAVEAPRLQLRLLGPPEFVLDGVPITFARRRTVAMFAFLAVTGQPQPRETLTALFTAEHVGGRASKHISNSLSELRQQLGDYIHADRHSISLSPTLQYSLDTRDLEQALQAPIDAADIDVDALQDAMKLYRGEFLEGFVLKGVPEFEEWQTRESSRLHSTYVRVLRAIAVAALEQRRYEVGLQAAARLSAVEPWDEEAIRHRMTLHARSGSRLEAQAEYEGYRRRLRRELEADPEPRTTQLYHAIREAATLPPNNLPSLPRVIGRAREVDHLTQLLASDDSRVVNVVGLGGTGKTRIALEVAFNYASGTSLYEQPYSDGVFFVAPYDGAWAGGRAEKEATPAGSLARHVCAQIGIHTSDDEPADEALLRSLRQKSALLVLDHADSATDELPALIFLLAEARRVKILVTSRTRLDIGADHVVEVGGLPHAGDWREIESTEAGALFLAEAARTTGSIDLDDANRRALARLCRETDGHPLALVVAAERCKTMSIEEIVAGIEESIDFLHSEARAEAPPRRLSDLVRDAWSVVEVRGQEALRRLALIAGSFGADAASAIARVSYNELDMLRDACLVACPTPGTYQIPRLVRRFVLEKAALDPDVADEVRARHASFYARALSRRTFGLLHAPDRPRQKALPEFGDLLLAGEWAASTSQFHILVEIRQGIRLWSELTGRYDEAYEVVSKIEECLSDTATRLPDDPVLPLALHATRMDTACLLLRLGRFELAASRIPAADELAESTSSSEVAISRHLIRGEAALDTSNIRRATEHFGSALRLAMSSHAPIASAVSSARLGGSFWRARANGRASTPTDGGSRTAEGTQHRPAALGQGVETGEPHERRTARWPDGGVRSA